MDNIILQKTWVQGSPVIVDNLLGTAFTGEAQAHTFVVSGVDAAQEPVAITGTITGKFLAANNVTVPLTGSLVNGAASVTLTDECYDVPGRYILSIYATNGETTQCLYCAVGNVFRTDSQTIAYPSTDLPNITTLMAQLEEILDGWPADYSQLQSDVSNLKSAFVGNVNVDIVKFSGVDATLSAIEWEQGNFTTSNDSVDSTKDVRTKTWISGGVFIYNPTRAFQFCVMQDSGSSKNYYTNFSNPVTGVDYYYDDKIAYIPKRKVGTYRIKITKRTGGTGSKEVFTPEQASVYLYEPVDVQFQLSLGAVASGGYSYNLTSLVSDELMVGNHAGIRFKLTDDDYRFAIYSTTNSTSFSSVNGGWQDQGECNVWLKDRAYVCRIGAKSGVTWDNDDALNSVKIEYIDDVYGYERYYNDISYSLDWEHKTVDATNGIVDSTTDIMAEIPSRGCIELKMNHTYTNFRFAVWKQAGNGTWTKLKDWTHYFYRYLPDEGAVCHYYVVCKCDSSGYTENQPFTLGLRGLRVYIYDDVGKRYNLPSPFYGKTVAVMGDSIVQGRFAKDSGSVNTVQTHPWPVLISERSNMQPADFGIGGATVYGDTWNTLYTNKDAVSGYDVVLVCAGTNDFGASVTEENFKAAYTSVLTALIASNTKVIAVTPTTRATNNVNSLGLSLSNYSTYIKDVSTTLDIPVIDLYTMTRGDNAFIATLTDDIHPNEAGQRIIADLILNNVPEQ